MTRVARECDVTRRPVLTIGVMVTLRYVTFSWSPWIMIGPGSVSAASSAPPVIASSVALSCTFLPFRTTVTLLPTRVASIVCHSPAGLLAFTAGAFHA